MSCRNEKSLFLTVSDPHEAMHLLAFRELTVGDTLHTTIEGASQAAIGPTFADSLNRQTVPVIEVIINSQLHNQLVTSRGSGNPAPLTFDQANDAYTVSSSARDILKQGARFKLEMVPASS